MPAFLVAIWLCSLAVSIPATAQDESPQATYQIVLGDLEYRAVPGLPGIETTTLYGSLSEPGLYATHARVSDGARTPPHTHPNTLTTWVTSGTAYVGTGRIFDESALKAYPAGSFFVTPAGSPHFIYAKDGDFSILDHGAGPSGVSFLEE